jgi:hypothetical protein
MAMNELHEREEALRQAARMRGLSLVTTGDTFALVRCEATLDEIEAFLGTDDYREAEYRRAEELKLANREAMLKAQVEMIRRVEAETQREHELLMQSLRSAERKISGTLD